MASLTGTRSHSVPALLAASIVIAVTLPASADFVQIHESGAFRLHDPPYELRCGGMLLGMWEGGAPWPFHTEFLTNRAILREGSVSDHATHVAGLMIGRGASPSEPSLSRGFCPAGAVHSWTLTNASSEFSLAVADGIVVANNSWGSNLGFFPTFSLPEWGNFGNSNQFGAYIQSAAEFDAAVRSIDLAGQTLVVVTAAGDDRDDGPICSGAACSANYHDGTWYGTSPYENPYYDCIDPQGTGKNSITVGAVAYGFMTPFSCFGPTDDGRIKPDIVAHGSSVYSARYPSATYGSATGTQFAAPAVSGAAVQVIEQYRRLNNGTTPRAAVVKALLLNSAQDRGPAGPDYSFGFGYLQARAAVDATLLDGGVGRAIRAEAVANGETRLYALNVPPDSSVPLEVMLAWIDPAAAISANPTLINDLDLRLIDPSGGVHYPWKLSAIDPPAAATATGPNRVDTVEQVVVAAPQAGIWQVEVKGGVSVGTTQRFGLVANYVLNAGAVEPVNLAFARNTDGASVDLSWNPVGDPDLAGWRIFRSSQIGVTSELLDTLPPGTTSYTDFTTPAVALLGYDVRAVYLRGTSREISERAHGLQTRAPRVVTPRDGSTSTAGQPTRIVGFAQPSSEVTVRVNPASPVTLGTVTADLSGLFWLDHTFATAGPRAVFAQAQSFGSGISIPSLENTVTLSSP